MPKQTTKYKVTLAW